MKRDQEIQKNVMEALKWTPLLEACEIGVTVKNGIVTLSGVVDTYPKKVKAEKVTRKVTGVRGIAEDIVVRISDKEKKTDSEIAQAILYELEWHSNLNPDNITVFVEDGNVTLEGKTDWDFQRRSADKAIWHIKGVRSITNNITLTPVGAVPDLKNKIRSAFERHANLDANKIDIEVKGHKIVLSGTVNSLQEKFEAEKAVWSAPGVDTIENKIECVEEEWV